MASRISEPSRTSRCATACWAACPGVAEVASVGGYQKQYQVTVDPNRLRANGVSLNDVTEAIRQSNNDVGGRILEMSGREY